MGKAEAIETGKLFGRASLLVGHQPDAAGDLIERAVTSMGALPTDALLAMILPLVNWLTANGTEKAAPLIIQLNHAAASDDAAHMRSAIERLLCVATEGGLTK